jgi:uncharacterized protein YggE
MKEFSNSVKISLIVAIAVIAVSLIISNSLSSFSPSETVTVDGVSEVSVMPDLISVYLNVETLNSTAIEAKDANSLIVSNVKDALIDAGFSRDDFETQNFNVYEEFDWSKNRQTSLGFRATHSIIVHVDADNEVMIGKAIDAAVDNGALLGYVNFELSQELENEYKAKAMRLAAEDARIKAEAVADGLGADIGKVVSTSTSDFGYAPWMAYSRDSVAGDSLKGAEIATNIQIAEQKINSRISVTYKLE